MSDYRDACPKCGGKKSMTQPLCWDCSFPHLKPIKSVKKNDEEAKRHLEYLRHMFESYRDVGKEKIAIRKMMPPLQAALLALDMEGIKDYPKEFLRAEKKGDR